MMPSDAPAGKSVCVLCGSACPAGCKVCLRCASRMTSRRRPKYSGALALCALAMIVGAYLLTNGAPSSSGGSATKMVTMKYVLMGEGGSVDVAVSGAMRDKLNNIPRVRWGTTDAQMQKSYIQDASQEKYIKLLVDAIRAKSQDPAQQARIAISIVQNIPYDTEKYLHIQTAQERYPYEVVYDQLGLCGEKSKLLALLLKDLGYGTALFHWPGVHQAVGVKCAMEYSYLGSGYCFIETVKPWVPSGKPLHYWVYGGGSLPDNPVIIPVNDGQSLDLTDEYYDAQFMQKTELKGRVLPADEYSQYMRTADKYGIQFDDGA